ncbi:MAG TPA: histidinol-phosphatase, partial [Planctomycetota bacterium]|nr:histidinol-phosphatase [Planctomycetota bacterium]
AEDLGSSDERFVEVYSGHPAALTFGDRTHASVEAMWDRALAARLRSRPGPVLYGVACDDAHHYGGKGTARPGRGWIMVRARELSADAIAGAMLAGDFYASTGVVLEKLITNDCGMSIRVAVEPGASYRIRFVGSRREGGEAGVLLQESEGPEAYYEFRGDELYVRGVVVSDRLHPDPTREGEVQRAWIQPQPVTPR